MAKKGNINVQTENIFPIIKQFLYSDHEIFLRELVSNAVDATQKVKTLKSIGELKTDINKLRVEVIIDKKKETLTIRDNGIGMTPLEQKKIFDKFFRASSGDIHDVKGHGLGLSYVKKIVDLHKGEIKLKSKKNFR